MNEVGGKKGLRQDEKEGKDQTEGGRERGERGQRGGQEDIFGGKKTTGLLEICVAK